MKSHLRIWNAVLGGLWLMDEERVRQLIDILDRPRSAEEIQAIEAQLGRPMDNARNVTVRDGVAVIPITGPIFRYANLFTYLSGATSTEELALDFTQALASPGIEGILLNVDSPGGEATGINELGDMIYAARGIKPLWAYVEGYGASAAYWLASATERIVVDETAALGSIGVVMAVPDPTKRDARAIEFVSSQSPNKRPDPTTEKGKAQLQKIVDDMADVFVGRVARNRDATTEQVLTDFGAGGVLIGQGAVKAGMADSLGAFEGTLAAMQKKIAKRRQDTRGYSARDYFAQSFKGATG